jgi:hypothetical protein
MRNLRNFFFKVKSSFAPNKYLIQKLFSLTKHSLEKRLAHVLNDDKKTLVTNICSHVNREPI